MAGTDRQTSGKHLLTRAHRTHRLSCCCSDTCLYSSGAPGSIGAASETTREVHGSAVGVLAAVIDDGVIARRFRDLSNSDSSKETVMTSSRPTRCLTGAMVGLALCLSGDLTAQRLPSPDSSRPPRITSLPADSIRLHVRQLRLSELLGGLQRGDTALVDRALGDVEWSPSDVAARLTPQCRSAGTALAALAGSSTEGALLPIYFSRFMVADSAGLGVATAALVIAGRSGRSRTATIRLTYDDAEQRWTAARGLLAALCAAAREPRS